MKRFVVLLLFLFYIFSIIGCKSNSNRAFKKFLNAEQIYAECYLTLQDNTASVKENILNLTICKNELEMYIPANDISLIVDAKEKNLLYANFKSNKYYYTKIDDSIEEEEKTEIDIKDYFKNMEYNSEKVMFDFDMKSYFEDNFKGFSDMGEFETIKFVANVEENEVVKLEMDFGSVLDEYLGVNSFIFSLENIKYNDDVVAIDYNIKYHDKVSTEGLLAKIEEDLMPQQPSQNPQQPSQNPQQPSKPINPVVTYNLYLNEYYRLSSDSELKLSGHVYGSNGALIDIEDCDVTFSPELDLSKIGETIYNVKVTYNDIIFSKQISVDIFDTFECDEKLDLDFILVENTFICGDYLLIADNKNIHKYDLVNNEVIGSVNLKCVANSIYLKDDYLYVAANYPYISGYLEEDGYDGTITKIRFSDFTLIDQMHVDCLPYSIIVDNRDNIIISKGHNQSIRYAIINLENKTFENLMNGYEKDYLIYNPVKDAFIFITQGLSSDNHWNYYGENGYQTEGMYPNSSLGIEQVSWVSLDGKIVLSTNYNGVFFATYDEDIEDYVNYKYEIPHDGIGGFSTLKACYEDGKIYVLCYEDGNTIAKLITINANTMKGEIEYLELEGEFVQGITAFNGKLYISYIKEANIHVYSLE